MKSHGKTIQITQIFPISFEITRHLNANSSSEIAKKKIDHFEYIYSLCMNKKNTLRLCILHSLSPVKPASRNFGPCE